MDNSSYKSFFNANTDRIRIQKFVMCFSWFFKTCLQDNSHSFPEFKQNHLSSYNNQSPYHIFREILACKECAFAVLNQKIDKILASISNDALLTSFQKQFETGKHSSGMRTGRISCSGRGDLLNQAFPRWRTLLDGLFSGHKGYGGKECDGFLLWGRFPLYDIITLQSKKSRSE